MTVVDGTFNTPVHPKSVVDANEGPKQYLIHVYT